MRTILYSTAMALALIASPALADSGPTQGNPNVAACIQPGADGKPVHKLSSEDVCPMYSFMRDDCNRLRNDPNAAPFALMHCGISPADRARDEGLTTGSTTPAPLRRHHR